MTVTVSIRLSPGRTRVSWTRVRMLGFATTTAVSARSGHGAMNASFSGPSAIDS